MATIKDLPYDLLYHIIFLLVQSSGGAEEFARIIAVCRHCLWYANDKPILRVVNFDIKMESVNFYLFQNVKGLLVKCSEVGNVAAQHALGKVILLSSTHLFLSKWQHARFCVSPCDRSTLYRRILDTNVPAQNNKVTSFMNYFSPIQAYTTEFSQTRLVHYKLVKLFLFRGSHHDFIEMGVFLKYCIEYFMGVTRQNNPLVEKSLLIASVKLLVKHALHVRSMERLAKTKESFNDCFRGFREFFEGKAKSLHRNFEGPSSAQSGYSSENMAADNIFLLTRYIRKCKGVGVNWQEALSDMNFVEALREDVCNQLNEAYTGFRKVRTMILVLFMIKFR